MRRTILACTAMIALALPATVSARPDRLPPPPPMFPTQTTRPANSPPPISPTTGAPMTPYEIAKAEYDAALVKYQADVEKWKADVAACKAGQHDKCVRVERKGRIW